ncbi:MAG: GTPase HflX [Candidatus Riflebacteria bacterium]|nr:GTPase HflX [Candidatus Riflebacteria bacterium]
MKNLYGNDVSESSETKVHLANSGENRSMITLAVQTPEQSDEDISDTLSELAELLETAGYTVAGSVVQKRPKLDRGSYFGTGKAEEVKHLIVETGAGGVVADDELSALQAKRLEEGVDAAVSDRTGVILEIFSKHASTREGKLQVELARLQYRLGHLIGGYSALSRQGGGIGTKGPGETKIETDRRVLKFRLSRLREELEKVVASRGTQRRKRTEFFAPLFALVGYTNAGKSTLLNALSGSHVQVHDGLFTTLDPTARRVKLPSGRTSVISDTVGFISKLPHALVQAFRATLEDVVNAQIVLHLTDVSHPRAVERIAVVRDVLGQIGVLEKETLMAFNKIDSTPAGVIESLTRTYPDAIFLSAKTGENMNGLLERIDTIMARRYRTVDCVMPSDSPLVRLVMQLGRVEKQEWDGPNVSMRVEVPENLISRLEPFLVTDDLR